MADFKYTADYAKTGRSGCKHTKCKGKIDKDALRIGKVGKNPFSDDAEDTATNWYHPECIFEYFKSARKTTKKIDSTSDIDTFDDLQPSDQKLLKAMIEDFVSGAGASKPKAKKAAAAKRTRSPSPAASRKRVKRDDDDNDKDDDDDKSDSAKPERKTKAKPKAKPKAASSRSRTKAKAQSDDDADDNKDDGDEDMAPASPRAVPASPRAVPASPRAVPASPRAVPTTTHRSHANGDDQKHPVGGRSAENRQRLLGEIWSDFKSFDDSKGFPVAGYPYGLSWESTNDDLHFLRSSQLSPNDKIAAFDMDHTLVEPKSGGKFPANRNDWKWLFPSIPRAFRHLHSIGYRIVIFTNQAGVEAKKQRLGDLTGKVMDMMKEVGVPMLCFMATAKNHWRKPNRLMWDYMVDAFNGGSVDLMNSFYCGDAAGRPDQWHPGRKKDFDVNDRKHAHNINVAFFTPEELFLADKHPKAAPFDWRGEVPEKLLEQAAQALEKANRDSKFKYHEFGYHGNSPIVSGKQELLVFCGSPASGKSSWAKDHLMPHGYFWVNQDTMKTKAKCISAARDALQQGKSVIIDNTNPEKGTRAEYLALARQCGVPCRCFYFRVPRGLTEHMNLYREKQSRSDRGRLSSVVFNVFRGKFVEPTAAEGFDEVCFIDWTPRFASDVDRRSFLEWT